VAGFELRSGLGGPWNLVEGSVAELNGEDTVIIDALYARKLGITKPGETVEMMNRRARVVGFTSGIRSFTTSPYVFTSFKNSQNYIGMKEHETVFLLVKLRPGYRPEDVQAAIRSRLPSVDVFTNEEMHRKTMSYWVFNTGAGVTTLMGAVLGLLVGMVVVAQTIYAATVDHIREYGTLKAMGARNSHLYRIILEQAALSAVMGYGIALAVSWFVVRSAGAGEAVILLPAPMAAVYFALALLMCVAASVISIRKATTIDPALVFRG
jgi:putative ABC transport system permease protein